MIFAPGGDIVRGDGLQGCFDRGRGFVPNDGTDAQEHGGHASLAMTALQPLVLADNRFKNFRGADQSLTLGQ